MFLKKCKKKEAGVRERGLFGEAAVDVTGACGLRQEEVTFITRCRELLPTLGM